MTLQLLLLTFASSFCWSVFDLSRKKLAQSFSVFSALFLFMLFSFPAFFLWGLFTDQLQVEGTYLGVGLLALAVNFSANSLFIWGVKISSFSRAVPMLSFSPVFAVVISFLVLGEALSFQQLLGVGLIFGGALILNGRPRLDASGKGPVLVVGAAAFWALLGVLDKICLRHASIPMHSFLQASGIALLCIPFLLRQNGYKDLSREKVRKKLVFLLLGSAASLMAIALQLYVVQFAPVGLVESAKRALTLALTLIIGRIFFAEHVNLKKILALIVMAAGLRLLLQ